MSGGHSNRKTSRQNSHAKLSNLLNQHGATGTSGQLSSTSSASATNSTTPSIPLPSTILNNPNNTNYISTFFHEISDIMHGFGDCERPLNDSVILVEKLLFQQLRGIVNEVVEVAVQRIGQPKPERCDFEYLLRTNPVKLHRLQKHIHDMSERRKIRSVYVERHTPGLSEQFKAFLELENNSDNELDQESEQDAPEKYDDEKVRRVFRADKISQMLNALQYNEYNKARRISFYSNSRTRQSLKQWLQLPTDITLSSHVYTILSYLAHETIATIVDYALLTRLDSTNRNTEPFSRVTPTGGLYTMLHTCPEVTQDRASECIKPITTREIHEAMRRFTMDYGKSLGNYRNNTKRNSVPFLAL